MTNNNQRPSILIVEDDVFNTADLESRLMALGYSICGKVTSAEKALDMVGQRQPDLVMMDIVLQGEMEGIEAAEVIRDNWGIPVVFLSAYADADRLDHAKLAYPFGYLLKPFREKDLKITVEMALYVARVDKERKNAENELRDSEEKFRSITEQMSETVFLTDLQGVISYMSPVAEEIFGFRPEEMVNCHFTEFLTKDTLEHAISAFAAALEKGIAARNIGLRMRRKDDSTFFGELSGSIYREHGMVAGTIGLIRDITAQKQIDDALRESEKKYRLLADNASDVIWIRDMDLNLTYVSPSVEMVRGYTPEEAMKQKLDEVLTPDSSRLAAETFVQMLEKREKGEDIPDDYTIDLEHCCKNGNNIWMDCRISFLKDRFGKPIGILGVSRDITDRKRTEEALKAQNQLINTLLDNLQVGVFMVETPSGKPILANKRAAKLLGRGIVPEANQTSLAEVYEAYKIETGELYPQDQMPIVRAMSGETHTIDDMVVMHPDGKKVLLEVFGSPVKDSLGNIVGGLVSFTDITERKRAEEERGKLQAQLQQSRKMEAIGTLAGGIAHDFNNLLQAIIGYTEMLLFETGENDSDYVSLKAIQDASNRAADLVRQLLLFSRKVETSRKPLKLNRKVEQSRKILERILPKMIEIEIHPGSGLWAIDADAVQIEQVLLNLGTNAADAMPNGGKLVIETENVTMNEGNDQSHLAIEPGNYVLLTVYDTGEGMDKEIVEHIFEPFYTTKEIGKGTGLGLASVYGIVKSHKGYIACNSEIGQGTIFKIYLPAMESMDSVETPDSRTKPHREGTETILLVDDEEWIRDFASKVLKRHGYTVLTASSGEDALETYSNKPNEIDLIIMDIGMPGMGGFRCLSEILRLDPSIRILIASGYSINGQVEYALKAGAAGYIGKPYQLADLLAKVRAVLDQQD